MITKETCVKIWNCWNEIDNANELISSLNKGIKETNTPTIHNAFGERVGLQLGIPSGSDSRRLYNVPLELSIKIILAHIEEQKRKLRELEAICLIELKDKTPE